jgi:elongation factor Ts
MNYTLTDIKKLREETGAAILDCKNALVQAQTWDEAVKVLGAKNNSTAERVKQAGRATGEGGIFSYIHHDRRIGVLLELRCSTDFVARSESFQQLARELTLQIAGAAPVYISYEDVPTGVIRETRKRLMEQNPVLAQAPVKKRGEMIGKRLKAALSEQVLLLQPWVKDHALTVGDLVSRVIAETGENIVVAHFCRYELGEASNSARRRT